MSKEPDQPDTTIKVTVEGVEYPLDLSEMTGREVGVLKRVGHIKGVGDLPEALQAGDLEVVVAVAVIAMSRAGVTADAERLLDAKMGVIRIDAGEGDAVPPAVAAVPAVVGAAVEAVA